MFETVVLDVDGGVVQQTNLIREHKALVLPLRERGGTLRFWCPRKDIETLRDLILANMRSGGPKAILYGSGDYHHLVYAGLSLVEEPVTVVHFDNHSDLWRERFVDLISLGRWRHRGQYLNYGSWVCQAMRLPHVKKLLQFGVDGDFSPEQYLRMPKGRVTHALELILDGRVETYPNRMKSSLLLGRIAGHLPCVDFEPAIFTTRAWWKDMSSNGGVLRVVEQALSTAPTEAVYVTIDKDVLDDRESFSAYPGFSGSMRLSELIAALKFIGSKKRIVGLDICGDASAFDALTDIPAGRKRIMADRQYARIPQSEFGAQRNILMNEQVNLAILESLGSRTRA